jgi:hypothetical protein
MGFCRDTVKPAIKNIRRQLTQKILQQIGEYMELMAPLVKDGNVDGQDAEKAVIYAVAAKNDISKTAVGMGVKLIHETVKRGDAELAEWAAGVTGDTQGGAEVDAFLA